MAGLISTGFWGFIGSCLPTGKRDEIGKPIYAMNFLSGFAGFGWKIWKTVAGFFRLEIDELVVRRTMTVFELLIQKIRAVKGAHAITQGNGKIKAVELPEGGTEYLITLEEDDMSFVEHDFIRCQEFSGGQRFYHVEIASVEAGIIRVPVSEFEGASLPEPGDEIVQFGNSSHDAKYAGRHSAIYMHADESGQPAIDVMFGIYSKDWTNCVKVRVGGDIPGTEGLKGFYCENGMIKCVKDNETVYQLHPDGSFNLGKGSITYDPATNRLVFGKDVVLTWDNLGDDAKENLKGEPGINGVDGINGKDGNDGLSVVWKGDLKDAPANPQKNWCYRDTDNGMVYIYNGSAWVLMVADGNDGTDGTDGIDGANGMSVFITYHDGEEEPALPTGNGTAGGWHTNATAAVVWMSQKVAADASSGEWGVPIRIKGKDGDTLPGWLENWNGYATGFGDDYIVTPKLFSGTKRTDENGVGLLTGIAQGRECITIDGVKKTGLFALVDNEVVFRLDPINKEYIFRGRVEADSGIFSGSIATPSKGIDDSNYLDYFEVNPIDNYYVLKFSKEKGFNFRFEDNFSINPMVIDLPCEYGYDGTEINLTKAYSEIPAVVIRNVYSMLTDEPGNVVMGNNSLSIFRCIVLRSGGDSESERRNNIRWMHVAGGSFRN